MWNHSSVLKTYNLVSTFQKKKSHSFFFSLTISTWIRCLFMVRLGLWVTARAATWGLLPSRLVFCRKSPTDCLMSISCYDYGKEECVSENLWRVSVSLYNHEVDGEGLLNPDQWPIWLKPKRPPEGDGSVQLTDVYLGEGVQDISNQGGTWGIWGRPKTHLRICLSSTRGIFSIE